jgi:hypothetical protein
VGGVEFGGEGDGLGGLSLLLVEAGELGVEGGVVGIFGEGGGEEGFGLIGTLLMQKEMGEGGGGVVILGVYGQEAAVGKLGGGSVTGGLGKLAGEKDVLGSFRGDLDGGEELVAGCGGVGVWSMRARAR